MSIYDEYNEKVNSDDLRVFNLMTDSLLKDRLSIVNKTIKLYINEMNELLKHFDDGEERESSF